MENRERKKTILKRMRWHTLNSEESVTDLIGRIWEPGMDDDQLDRRLSQVLLEEHNCTECEEADPRHLAFSSHGEVWCAECYAAIGGIVQVPECNRPSLAGVKNLTERLDSIIDILSLADAGSGNPILRLRRCLEVGCLIDRGTVLKVVERLQYQYDKIITGSDGTARKFMNAAYIRAVVNDLLEATGDTSEMHRKRDVQP